jgi:hypothetical protein
MSRNTNTTTPSAGRWWRPKFGMRTMLIALLLVSVVLGSFSWRLRRAWAQARLVAQLREMEVVVDYRYDRPEIEELPLFVRLLRNPDGFQWYGESVLTKDFFDDVTAIHASHYHRVEFIRTGAPISFSDVEQFWNLVYRMPSLEMLDVQNDQITPGQLGGLKQNPQLWALGLQSIAIGDSQLEAVGQLTGLRRLSFGGGWFAFLDDEQRGKGSRAYVSRGGLEHLRSMPDLEMLILFGTTVDDNAVEPLSHLHNLTHLDLGNTPLGDEGLGKLTTLKKLQYIYLRGTNVTATGVRDFQAALPGCIVDHPATDPPAPANAPGVQPATAGGSADVQPQR